MEIVGSFHAHCVARANGISDRDGLDATSSELQRGCVLNHPVAVAITHDNVREVDEPASRLTGGSAG